MTTLDELKPTTKNRVMDLVQLAGIDVSDWANFKGGLKKAASNPKYCYEWSFEIKDALIVLNLWHSNTLEENGEIYQSLNLRLFADKMGKLNKKTVEKRAVSMDVALQHASNLGLPIRVILLDGDMQNAEILESKASHVYTRTLDTVEWAVKFYDWKTGECIISRGLRPSPYVDQFDLLSEPGPLEKKLSSTSVYPRSSLVRKRVLLRAKGNCELCNTAGFITHNNLIYLESHHVIPLSEGGNDNINNVVALCPLCHKQAHHGLSRDEIRQRLKSYLHVN
ncbi:MAG TPA: HNH endonuclease signature motif containing protein [Methylophilaceae bacterium]|nr:HNH endonuclease signature motif containing protein [Methylophilaceae bacterium]